LDAKSIIAVASNYIEEQRAELAIFFSSTDFRKIDFTIRNHNGATAGTTIDWGKLSWQCAQ